MAATCTVPKLVDRLTNELKPSSPITLQVKNMQCTKDRWKCSVTSGSETMIAVFTKNAMKDHANLPLPFKDGSDIKILDGTINMVGNNPSLLILQFGVVEESAAGSFVDDMPKIETPAVKRQNTSGMSFTTPTPSESNSFSFGTPKSEPLSNRSDILNFTPPSATMKPSPKPSPPASQIKGPFSPLEALNPYDSNWKIKAKVTRKYPVKTFNKSGKENKLMTLELLDEHGTAIRATMWRDAVDKYEHVLDENKVFAFHKFQVKPANKAYSAFKHDYELHMDWRLQMEELAGDSMAHVTAKLNLVPFEHIPKYINKASFDLMGIVLSVGELGSVKRKVDQTEVTRRDIVLGDDRHLSVSITLWGDNATTEAEALSKGNVVSLTSCRASDYNGCSVSALKSTVVQVEPEHPRTEELRSWWAAESPAESAFTAVGQGLVSGQQRAPADFKMLKDIKLSSDAPIPAPDAAPVNSQALITVSAVPHDQNLYYLANKKDNKKVTEGPGGYVDSNGSPVEDVERRYVGYCKVLDHTSEVLANFFNNEGMVVLGKSADEVHSHKEMDQHLDIFKEAQWTDYVATVQARSREYNGEVKMRYTITKISKVDYAQQGHRLLELIKGF